MINHTIASTGHRSSIEDPSRTHADGTVPLAVFQIALDVVNDLASKTAALMNDSHLSSTGREHSIKPLRESAWSALAACYTRIGALWGSV